MSSETANSVFLEGLWTSHPNSPIKILEKEQEIKFQLVDIKRTRFAGHHGQTDTKSALLQQFLLNKLLAGVYPFIRPCLRRMLKMMERIFHLSMILQFMKSTLKIFFDYTIKTWASHLQSKTGF